MEYLTQIKVRGYHADSYGHVNNARYLEFFEEDRWALLESKVDLEKWRADGLIFLVVNINVNYRKAVGPGAILLVSTALDKIGRASAVLRQHIVLEGSGDIVADALVTFVLSDSNDNLVAMDDEVAREIGKLANLEQ